VSEHSRFVPKVFRIGANDPSPRIVLKERLDVFVKVDRYQHGKPMSVKACAQRLSTILYQKHFFPYDGHAVLGGIGEGWEGCGQESLRDAP
jgi:20S proteasome subunit beta 6